MYGPKPRAQSGTQETTALAQEMRISGILVNAVCPGFTATSPEAEEMGARPVSAVTALVELAIVSDKEDIPMVLEAVKDQILDDLDQLTLDQQVQAAELVHGLISDLPRGASGRSLLRFSGVIDEQSAHEMTVAIEEECERVEPHGW